MGFVNPNQTTGYWDVEGAENAGVTLYDPRTGEYVHRQVDPNNTREYNPSGDLTRWTYTPEGERVLTLMPRDEAGEMVRPHFNFDLEGIQWGHDPAPVTRPPTHGMGEDGRPVETAPDDRYPVQDSVTTDLPPINAGTPSAPLYSGTRDTSWEWADGGGHSYFGAPPVNENLNMPGQESPWGVPDTPGNNQDFYRAQFSNLLSQQNALREAEMAAQEIRNQGQPAQQQGDPWAWAYGGQGIPEVVIGAAPEGDRWQLREGIIPGETSNADVLRQVAQLSAFNDRGEAVRALLNQNPDWDNTFSWSQVPDPNTGIQNHIGSGWGPSAADVFNTMFTNMFVDTTQPQSGMPHVPQGYASPGNVAWGGE